MIIYGILFQLRNWQALINQHIKTLLPSAQSHKMAPQNKYFLEEIIQTE